MANKKLLAILKRGVEDWNRWREEHPEVFPELSEANLSRANLSGVNLSEANLVGTNFYRTDLSRANLRKANLNRSNLTVADLTEADLTEANLKRAVLTEANLSKANLTGCFVYAVSAWDLNLEDTIQSNLIITRLRQVTITVDNIEIAQFIYLLLNNQKIRSVIDTITSKVVLILGRFTSERKAVLDALRDELREYDYLPVIFDFEKPAKQDLTETVSTLAHLARFIIVDLTDPSSAPHEMASVVPHCIVPVQPLLLGGEGQREYAMFGDLRIRYHWVLPTYRYQGIDQLLSVIKEQIIAPAEEKARELERRK